MAAVEAVKAHGGNISAAARELNMPRRTLQHRLNRAAERGLAGFKPVLPGFAIKSVATKAEDGSWVKQTKEHGEVYELPAGHQVKAESALVDAEGRLIQRWVKTAEEPKAAATKDAIEAAFRDYNGPAALPAPTKLTDTDLLTIYPIVDLHLGLYAWGQETGADYDIKIASDLLRSSVRSLVSRSMNSRTAVVLDMGDYFHTDDSRNQTRRSGNPLDVDTRYARVLQVGVELVVEVIELALQKHDKVIYRKLPGNHDDESSLMLAIAIASWFRDNPRVQVDTSPSRFYMQKFGQVMIAATHGDMLKMGDMPSFMAANWPKEWGETEYRYAYTGHVHHDRVKFDGGVRAESFNTLAAKDSWHAASGYVANRSAVSITMHKDRGEIDRLTVNLPRASRSLH